MADLVGRYGLIVYPGFLANGGASLVGRFFLSQRVIWPQFLPAILVLPLHFTLCYILSDSLGFEGIALSMCITYIAKLAISLSFLLKCCKCLRSRETIQPFSKADFQGWGTYLKVAVPAMALSVIEWWSFELSTIVCSFTTVSILAGQTVIMNYGQMLYLVSAGCANALATLVGNAIGMGRPYLAKLFARDGILFALSIASVLVLLSIIFRDWILSFFT